MAAALRLVAAALRGRRTAMVFCKVQAGVGGSRWMRLRVWVWASVYFRGSSRAHVQRQSERCVPGVRGSTHDAAGMYFEDGKLCPLLHPLCRRARTAPAWCQRWCSPVGVQVRRRWWQTTAGAALGAQAHGCTHACMRRCLGRACLSHACSPGHTVPRRPFHVLSYPAPMHGLTFQCWCMPARPTRSDAFHKVALAGIENKPELKGLDRAQVGGIARPCFAWGCMALPSTASITYTFSCCPMLRRPGPCMVPQMLAQPPCYPVQLPSNHTRRVVRAPRAV